MSRNINEKLIERAGAGDVEAFSEIYFALRDPIFGFAFRMLGESSIAEDITHDVFVFFIENPKKYESRRASLLSFLCGVTRNKIMHYLRKRGNHLQQFEDSDEDFIEVNNEIDRNPLDNLLDKELSTKFEESLIKLSPLQREVIILREMQELSYDEIAEITGAEISAVKVRIHRARKNLGSLLAPYLSDKKKERFYEMC